MITVTFHCGGCDAAAQGTRMLRREFHGITGRPWGFGSYVEDKASDLAPEGWIPFDLIGATHCPSCAAELWPAGRRWTDAEADCAEALLPGGKP